MFGSKKKREQAGWLYQQAGIEVFKNAESEIVQHAAETGNMVVPDPDPEKGYVLYQRMMSAGSRSHPNHAHRAIGRAAAGVADALRADTEMDEMQKRLDWRQSMLACALIYPAIVKPGTADEAVATAQEWRLALEDDYIL